MPALPQKFFVTLLRGAFKLGARTWEHTNKRAAQARAHTLCHLHGVREATFDDRTCTFTVDASEFYGKGI